MYKSGDVQNDPYIFLLPEINHRLAKKRYKKQIYGTTT